MKIFLLFISITLTIQIFSQTISGIVVDASTQKAVPYVNIGIPAKGIGTVSQENGKFVLDIAGQNENDTVKFSCLGYEPLYHTIKELRKNDALELTIAMKPHSIKLKDVVIVPKKTGTDILGNTFDSRAVTGAFNSEMLGCEIGTLMKVKHRKTYYLEKVGVNFTRVSYDSILFRLNIYTFENELPVSLINAEPIFVMVYRNQEEAKIDLRKYNLTTDKDFVVSLEWIQDVEGSNEGVGFCAGFFGANCFYKTTSQDAWTKAPATIGIGLYCVAEYEK